MLRYSKLSPHLLGSRPKVRRGPTSSFCGTDSTASTLLQPTPPPLKSFLCPTEQTRGGSRGGVCANTGKLAQETLYSHDADRDVETIRLRNVWFLKDFSMLKSTWHKSNKFGTICK